VARREEGFEERLRIFSPPANEEKKDPKHFTCNADLKKHQFQFALCLRHTAPPHAWPCDVMMLNTEKKVGQPNGRSSIRMLFAVNIYRIETNIQPAVIL
jgi:hypothetical protein